MNNFTTKKLRVKWTAELQEDLVNLHAIVITTFSSENKPKIGDYYYNNNVNSIVYKDEYKSIIPKSAPTYIPEKDSLLFLVAKKRLSLEYSKNKKKVYYLFADNKGNRIILRYINKRYLHHNVKLTKVDL